MPVIHIDDVSVCYRLAKQRIPSLKEYAVQLVKGALTYHDLWALKGVSATIEEGEVVGIVGRNGAGKTTLLKVICGIFQPTKGTVVARGRIAPLFQLGTGFDSELTGRENILLNALLLGQTRREVRARLDEIIDFAELDQFIDAPLRNYSSGMVARLGFAIATAWTPDILILDEVLSVGDAEFRAKCHERMQRIRNQGTTILMVSHAESSILQECTRCLWLADGRLLADGSPRSVLERYARWAS